MVEATWIILKWLMPERWKSHCFIYHHTFEIWILTYIRYVFTLILASNLSLWFPSVHFGIVVCLTLYCRPCLRSSRWKYFSDAYCLLRCKAPSHTTVCLENHSNQSVCTELPTIPLRQSTPGVSLYFITPLGVEKTLIFPLLKSLEIFIINNML